MTERRPSATGTTRLTDDFIRDVALGSEDDIAADCLIKCANYLKTLEAQLDILTGERNEARRTVELLCELIAHHPDPALAEMLPDILDPRERT
jgi:hypothetical protein